MKVPTSIVVLLIGTLAAGFSAASGQSPATTPSEAYLGYTPDGRAEMPQNYRDWAFLTSGVDMSYSKGMTMTQHLFNNIFVDPDGLRGFKATGTWPDGTVVLIENRSGQSKGSINKAGIFQAGPVQGLEVHVKDSVRFKGGWAFFAFGGNEPAQQIPLTASCYSCHRAHAAVDTTFVQFYPTLLEIAKQKRTLGANYLSDEKASANAGGAKP